MRPAPPVGEPSAVIDLGAIQANLEVVRGIVGGGTKVMAAVKADAYGHGLLEVARRLELAGVDWFGVATPAEALALRSGGVRGGVLLLGPLLDPEQATLLADAGVSVTLTDQASLDLLLKADLPRPLSVQVAVDTGMGRIGLGAAKAAELATRAASERRLELEGVWTHLAAADDPDTAFTEAQLDEYEEALALIARAGVSVPLKHAANSAGLIAHERSHFDMVRAGILLYGHHASPWVAGLCPPLRPAMRLEAPVTFVKRVRAGTPVSYGGLWHANEDTTVATLRIGYADGYPRLLTGRGWAALGGRRCEVAGRVCMDQLMLDVGAGEVRVGDRAVLWGAGGPDVEELAASIGTISYELLTGVGRRVARIYQG